MLISIYGMADLEYYSHLSSDIIRVLHSSNWYVFLLYFRKFRINGPTKIVSNVP